MRIAFDLQVTRQLKIGFLGMVVSALAIAFILTQINVGLFWDSLRQARYVFLIPTILFLLLGLVTRAIRWQILLNGRLPLVRAFSIMNVAYLVNGVLPLRIGEVARIYLATRVRKPVPAMQTAGTIVVERLLDLLAVVVLMALALVAGNDVPEALRSAGLFSGVIAVVGFGMLIVFAHQHALLEHVLDWFKARIPFLQKTAIDEWLATFLDGLQPLTDLRLLIQAVGWTTISWVLSVIAGYILMFAFYPQGDWSATALYIAAAAFAIALPAVPGNIGTYEASIMLALTALGYEQGATAVAFAVMVHAVNVFVHATTGVIGFIQEGISLEQLSDGVQQIRQEKLRS